MTGELNFKLSGDDTVLITGGAVADLRAFGRQLRDANEWLEVVDGISDVSIQFDPVELSPHDALARLQSMEIGGSEDGADAGEIVLAVRFGGAYGPDVGAVCSQLGLSLDELIRELTNADLYVDMMGFTPGFAYISGVPEQMNVPRLKEPRKRVPAGSLGLAAGKCGTYSLEGPGGWPLIGRISTPLFDPASDMPFKLQSGMRIRLQPEAAG